MREGCGAFFNFQFLYPLLLLERVAGECSDMGLLGIDEEEVVKMRWAESASNEGGKACQTETGWLVIIAARM